MLTFQCERFKRYGNRIHFFEFDVPKLIIVGVADREIRRLEVDSSRSAIRRSIWRDGEHHMPFMPPRDKTSPNHQWNAKIGWFPGFRSADLKDTFGTCGSPAIEAAIYLIKGLAPEEASENEILFPINFWIDFKETNFRTIRCPLSTDPIFRKGSSHRLYQHTKIYDNSYRNKHAFL